MSRSALTLIAMLILTVSSAFAQTNLAAADKARAQTLFLELRCVVCQNQSIAESDADVARDLREIVSEQIAAGASDAQIKTYLVDRYGEFILLKPVLAPHTLLLWLTPLLMLLAGLWLAWSKRGRAAPGTEAPLTSDEEQRLRKIV